MSIFLKYISYTILKRTAILGGLKLCSQIHNYFPLYQSTFINTRYDPIGKIIHLIETLFTT